MCTMRSRFLSLVHAQKLYSKLVTPPHSRPLYPHDHHYSPPQGGNVLLIFRPSRPLTQLLCSWAAAPPASPSASSPLAPLAGAVRTRRRETTGA